MARGQTEQFIGIAILVMVIVGFVMVSKLNSMKSNQKQSEQLIGRSQNAAFEVAVGTIPLTKVRAISLAKMWGDACCTGRDIISYDNIRINVTAETIKKMDLLFGKGRWGITIFGNHTMVYGRTAIATPRVLDFIVYESNCTVPAGRFVPGRMLIER